MTFAVLSCIQTDFRSSWMGSHEKHPASYSLPAALNSFAGTGSGIVGKTGITSTVEDAIIYVHVGKTGGTTLESVLRASCEWYDYNKFRKAKCLENLEQNLRFSENNSTPTVREEPVISQKVKATLHMKPWKSYYDWINSTEAFLVTVRDPLSRFVSAFNYGHPNNTNHVKLKPQRQLFYLQCFNSTEELAQLLCRNLQPNPNFTKSERECLKTGNWAIRGHGQRRPVEHLYYNYEFYANYTFWLYPDRKLYILRLESLWSDLIRLETMLGGNGDESFNHLIQTVRMGSDNFNIRSGLSASGVRTACCYLARENMVYEYLIRHGINLDELEKKEALEALYDRCSVSDLVVHRNYSDPSTAFDWEEWSSNTCFGGNVIPCSS